MSRYLNTTGRAVLTIAVCRRCSFKKSILDLSPDPDSGLMVCADCTDAPDRWLQPPRETEDISVWYTNPDVPLTFEPQGVTYLVRVAMAATELGSDTAAAEVTVAIP